MVPHSLNGPGSNGGSHLLWEDSERVFRRGWNLILVALLDHAPLPLGRFVPEPWPAVPVPETEPLSPPVLALPQAA